MSSPKCTSDRGRSTGVWVRVPRPLQKPTPRNIFLGFPMHYCGCADRPTRGDQLEASGIWALSASITQKISRVGKAVHCVSAGLLVSSSDTNISLLKSFQILKHKMECMWCRIEHFPKIREELESRAWVIWEKGTNRHDFMTGIFFWKKPVN